MTEKEYFTILGSADEPMGSCGSCFVNLAKRNAADSTDYDEFELVPVIIHGIRGVLGFF